ncbi:MAG: hypothetical protein IKW83_11240 [Muribaculaceae bacterium]|nr:hypothetical protein [Muribaculaceae bacterium]
MLKLITEETIRQECSSRIELMREKFDSLLKSVEEETKSMSQRFEVLVDEAGFSTNAFVPSLRIDFSKDPAICPDGLYLGMFKHSTTGVETLPALLPFTASNATGFCTDASCDAFVIDLMQMLAMRILLSIPVELAKFHFIDLHSYGQSAKHFNRITEKVTNGALICEKRKLSEFITELENIMGNLNRNELLDNVTLREYNAEPSHIGVPYHFVFIPHIHDRIDKDIISRLYSLCSGMNAANCGIYVFYSIDPNVIKQENDPLKDLMGISTLVSKDANGFRLSNSIYGKDFEEKFLFEPERRMPENLDAIIEEIGKRANNVKPKIVSFDQMLEDMIASGEYWKGNTTDGITIPIGRKGANGLVNFTLAGDTAHYFAMIGGRPGYGKTVLLHDIICNGSIIYSPQELEFYLIDCTNGTGFKPYENLPHARFVSITKQREYTDSAIEHLVNEMYRRADLFKEASNKTGEAIEKIEKYRKITGNMLPRIVVIIDEFQVLLEKHDRLSMKIGSTLEKIIREGRKYGISIIFCTQSYRNIDLDTELITLRIAFNLKEMDSYKVLGGSNDSAAHLTKKGEAIMNGNNGEKDGNIIFQAAFTDKMQRYVSFCIEAWEAMDCEKPKRFVFDGKAVSKLGKNGTFIESLTSQQLDPDNITTYIGVPMFIRGSHSYLTFRKAIGSNLIICGTDLNAALSTIALVNYQICQTVEVQGSVFIADFFSESSEASRYIRQFAKIANIGYLQKKELSPFIDQLEQLLKMRIDNDMAGNEIETPPVVATIAYIQNALDMKKNQYGQPAPLAEKIQNILRNGPDYGIHLIVYSYTYKGLIDILDNSALPSLGNRVILQSGAIGMQLMDEANALAEGTALLVTEDGSTTYEQDPVMIYNEFKSEMLHDEVLDYIFSIYNNQQ